MIPCLEQPVRLTFHVAPFWPFAICFAIAAGCSGDTLPGRKSADTVQPADAPPEGATVPLVVDEGSPQPTLSDTPGGISSPTDGDSAIRLSLSRAQTGDIVFDLAGEVLDRPLFLERIASLRQGDGGPPIVLDADKSLAYAEVVDVIDSLASAGLNNVSLGPGATEDIGDGAKILAWVGPEVVLAADLAHDVHHFVQTYVERHEHPPAGEEIENFRRVELRACLNRAIKTKLVIVEARREIDSENWGKFEAAFEEQFDAVDLPKLLEDELCRTPAEFDLKLRKQGASLANLRRSVMEFSFATYFIEEKIKDPGDRKRTNRKPVSEMSSTEVLAAESSDAAHASAFEERKPQRRLEYLADLRKKTPVWTIFDDQERPGEESGKTSRRPVEPFRDDRPERALEATGPY